MIRALSTQADDIEGTMNTLTRIAAVTLLTTPAALSLTACTTHDQRLPKEVTSALETAFNKGDIQGCTELFTDDAEIISKSASAVRGHSAIKAFFKDQVAREIMFDTNSKVSVVSGNVAMEQGTYRVRNVIRGVDVEYGDYLNVWRKTDGQWKAYRSMYNVTYAPSVLVSVVPDGDDGRAM
jgi:ketosteroid isomerase-like protein